MRKSRSISSRRFPRKKTEGRWPAFWATILSKSSKRTRQVANAFKTLLGKSCEPLKEILQVETPAVATPDGGLTFTMCKAHACGDMRLVVYITPALNLGAILFHNDGDIGLPEAPVKGEENPDGYSRLVLYEDSAYPPRMLWPLYQAAYADLKEVGMDKFSIDETHGHVSPRFWIVGRSH